MALDWKIFTQRPYIASLSLQEQVRLFNIANEKSIRLREQRFVDFANSNSTSQGAAGDGDTGVTPFTNTKSIDFDGVNDYIDCGNDSSLEITSNFSISVWVNLNTMTGYIRIIGKANSDNSRANYGLGFFGGNRPGVIANATGGWFENYSANPLSTGVWHHLVGVYDGSNFILYVNGSLDKSTSVSGFNIATAASATSGDSLLIGRIPSGAESFNGKIDEVAIFNSALSSEDITNIYNSGTPNDLSSYSSLVAWWRMGDGDTFPTITDNKGNNDGTMTNMDSDDIVENVPT